MMWRLKHKLETIFSVSRKEMYALIFPAVWFLLFLLLPFLILLKISFSDYTFGMPPVTEVFQWMGQQHLQINLHFQNYVFFFKDNLYIWVYLESILIAFSATCIAVVLSYPFAYAIHKCEPRTKTLLILLILLPFYTSFLLRVYAWVGLLGKQGIINGVLLYLGIINEPIQLLYTKFAVLIGIVYCYFPFMVIPVYLSLDKMNREYLEAAYDLGCQPIKAFFTITLPNTRNGLISGFVLMFIPAIGEFVIPEILGGANTLMIGRIVWNEFFNNRDWPFASAIAVLMFAFVVVPLHYLNKANQSQEGREDE